MVFTWCFQDLFILWQVEAWLRLVNFILVLLVHGWYKMAPLPGAVAQPSWWPWEGDTASPFSSVPNCAFYVQNFLWLSHIPSLMCATHHHHFNFFLKVMNLLVQGKTFNRVTERVQLIIFLYLICSGNSLSYLLAAWAAAGTVWGLLLALAPRMSVLVSAPHCWTWMCHLSPWKLADSKACGLCFWKCAVFCTSVL